ncbi:MAG TPA: matrixin family metalloprotease [Rhizomicrobium sp.]|nr:matrixin family metalloprotease [Rhizomicrobium sp.]
MSRLWTRIMMAAALSTCVVAARADDAFRLLQIDGRSVKWGAPVLGQGATISYAVINGPSNITGNVNCLRITGIKPLLAHSQMTRRVFDHEVAAALALWQSAANLRFVAAKRVAKADIVFSAEAQPDGIGYADVTLAGSGERNVSRLKRGIVCLNPEIQWKSNASGAHDSDSGVQLRYALAHEIGHVLGLDHPGPEGELMSFEYGSRFDGLKPGDIAGIAALYGRRNPVPVLALASRSPTVR